MPIVPFQRVVIAATTILREYIADKLATVDNLEEAGNVSEMVDVLGHMGELSYLAQDYEAAIPLLRRALTLAETMDDERVLMTMRLRLATALQYADRHDEAAAIFRQGLAVLTGDAAERYRDFFLQHYGKCMVEMGRFSEARACFLEALRLRQERMARTGEPRGNRSLIGSTERALEGLAEREAER